MGSSHVSDALDRKFSDQQSQLQYGRQAKSREQLSEKGGRQKTGICRYPFAASLMHRRAFRLRGYPI